MKKGTLLLLVVIVAALAGAGWFFKGGVGKDKKGATTAVAQVERRDLEIAAEAAGLVEPIRVVEVKSRASGEVLRVNVDTGDRVDAGTLLSEIDPRDVQNALSQAVADLESTRVQRDTAEANRQRMEELRKSGTATQQEFEAAVQSSAAARAAVVRTQTNLQLAQQRRGDVTIKAPIAGTVLLRAIQPGQIIASALTNVSGGTTLFTMADLSEMQVRAKVDETDIGQVQPGQAASVSVEAYPGRVFQGKVFKIEPQAVVEQNVTLFPVLIRLENPDGLLRPGMNAEVKVQISSRKNTMAVPNAAVVSMRDARGAATLLGLDESAVKGRGGGGGDRDGGVALSAECEKLRDQARSGGFAGLSEADRSALRACREQSGGGGRQERGSGGNRPAFVFVQKADNQYEARRVMVGLSDWEFTEVLEGLEEGEKVVLVSVAQLQKEQQDRQNRMRNNSMMPGAGGGGRGRGG